MARADLRPLAADALLRGSWLVGALLLAIGLCTATGFSKFVVLSGVALPDGFYTRQAMGLVLLALGFPFVVLGAVLGGGDYALGTYQSRVLSAGRATLGLARLLLLFAISVSAIAVVVGVATVVDVVRPEVRPLGLVRLLALVASASMDVFLWGAIAMVLALVSGNMLTGLLLTWGMLTAEAATAVASMMPGIAKFLPLHVSLSALNAITNAAGEDVLNLRPSDLLDPLAAAVVAVAWIGTVVAVYLGNLARRDF